MSEWRAGGRNAKGRKKVARVGVGVPHAGGVPKAIRNVSRIVFDSTRLGRNRGQLARLDRCAILGELGDAVMRWEAPLHGPYLGENFPETLSEEHSKPAFTTRPSQSSRHAECP